MSRTAPDIQTGAARQDWRAALCLWAVVALALGLVHAGPGPTWAAEAAFALAFALAGYAVTRMMTGQGSPPRLIDVWGRLALWAGPALVVVIAAVLLASVALLPPADLRDQSWTAAWTSLGLGGAQLWKQGAWDPRTSSDLLLHGWAPGVAAQLVLGWTLVVTALQRSGGRRWIAPVAIAGAALSLILDIQMRRQGLGIQNFYLAPGHGWPFLCGALAARFEPRLAAGPWTRPTQVGLRAGAVALPFVLWIWPLLALPRLILARPLTLVETIAAFVAAGLLAVAGRRWIERPLRRRLAHRPVAALALLTTALGALCVAGLALFTLAGLPDRASPAMRAEAEGVQRRPPMQAACHTEGEALPPVSACTVPAGRAADVVLWGNSHGSHLGPAVFAWTGAHGLAARQATKSGCLPLIDAAGGLADPGCVRFNRAAVVEWGRAPRPRVILVGAGWTVLLRRRGADSLPALEAGLDRMLDALRTSLGPEPRIVLIGTTPDYAFAPGACHARRLFLGLDTARCDRAGPANAALAAVVDARLEAIAARHAKVSVFRPWTALCDGATCRTRSGDQPWYVDTSHMTEAGGLAQLPALAGVLDRAVASGDGPEAVAGRGSPAP